MKSINLISLKDSLSNLSQELLISYLKYYSITIKPSERIDLISFINELNIIEELYEEDDDSNYIFDNYFIGFKIPQIGKEFDLLRIGDKEIVNIELKRESTHDAILKQLILNKYYLSFLDKTIHNYTYISTENKLYKLDIDNNLIESNFTELSNILNKQKIEKIYQLDNLFKPSDYLVSPFNSTKEFMEDKYFLTQQQEQFKVETLKIFNTLKGSFISIKGKAGTGKTLLTYDIAKELIKQGESILILHCGILNNGHCKLRDTYKWNVIAIRDIYQYDLSKYSLIIIDECQRIYPNQLKDVIKIVKANNSVGIFSYDSQQYLRNWELNNNNEYFLEEVNKSKTFALTDKIRTNKEIALFIGGLFQKNKVIVNQQFSNVEINYFDNHKEAYKFIELLRINNWKAINYTPSTKFTYPYEKCNFFDEFDNSHTVIGQEYDNVIAVIDKHFYYNGNRLSTKGYKEKPYYHPSKMLFQIVTRTKFKLNVIIINNPEILERCLAITNQ